MWDDNERTIEDLKAEVERRSHPAAKVFPLLIDTDENAWEEFYADVGANGLRSPIVIDRRRHDDVSVRAAQLAKLLEMLKVENFPTPTVPVVARRQLGSVIGA